MKLHTLLTALTLTAGICLATARAADDGKFVDTFQVKPTDFRSVGRNDFFILEPNYQLILEGKVDGKPNRLIITVLDKTKKIDGVETRVVEEYETADGKLTEISRNYFAIDKSTSDIYYFGEDVDEYKDGVLSGHAGAWRSGKDGAKFGLMVPGKPVVGQKFAQEVAPKIAMDRGEVVGIAEDQVVPAGKFTGCLKVKETSPIEPDSTEFKVYAPGIGLVVDDNLELVKKGISIEKVPQKPAAAKVEPVEPLARDALALVGTDPAAELVWSSTINDPTVPAEERKNLIEDLNEDGFADPNNITPDELPLVMSRIALIDQMAPVAMDDTNLAAFNEAYKDLTNIAAKLLQ